MRLLLLNVLLVLIVGSCGEKNQLPKGILPKPKMREVMWDIVRAEEFLNSFVMYRDTGIDKAAIAKLWYDKVYKIHGISEADFEKSYSYYKDHDLLKEVLDSLAKKAPPAQPVKDTTLKRDTLKTTDTVSMFGRKRLLDTLKKKRILKKISNPS